MRLGTTILPSAKFGGPIATASRQQTYSYDWDERAEVVDLGSGPSTFTIRGTAHNLAEYLAVQAACEAARKESTPLYFLRDDGSGELYYTVKTGPCRPDPLSTEIWAYEFSCITTPYPYIYDAETGERVT